MTKGVQPIKVSIRLSRTSGGRGIHEHDVFNLTVADETSGVQFLDVDILVEAFADLLSSRQCLAEGVVRVTDVLGMTHVREKRSIVAPSMPWTSQKDNYRDWLLANAAEEGWIIDTYLGSQGSIVSNQNGTVELNYSVHKYVEPTNG